MTAPTHSLSPSPSTSPKGVDQLAREAGTLGSEIAEHTKNGANGANPDFETSAIPQNEAARAAFALVNQGFFNARAGDPLDSPAPTLVAPLEKINGANGANGAKNSPETGFVVNETPGKDQESTSSFYTLISTPEQAEAAHDFTARQVAAMTEVQKERARRKGRCFSLMQYRSHKETGEVMLTQEQLDAGLAALEEQGLLDRYAMIFHDKDVEDGHRWHLGTPPTIPPKPLHMHAAILLKDGRMRIGQLARLFDLPPSRVAIGGDKRRGRWAADQGFFDLCQYMVHEDKTNQLARDRGEPYDYPYPRSEVKSNFDFSEFLDGGLPGGGNPKKETMAERRRALRRLVGQEGMTLEEAEATDFDAFADDLPRLEKLRNRFLENRETGVGSVFTKASVLLTGPTRAGKDVLGGLITKLVVKIAAQAGQTWHPVEPSSEHAPEDIGAAEVVWHQDIRYRFTRSFDDALRYLDPANSPKQAGRNTNRVATSPRLITMTSSCTPTELALTMKTRRDTETLALNMADTSPNRRQYPPVNVDEFLYRLGFVVDVWRPEPRNPDDPIEVVKEQLIARIYKVRQKPTRRIEDVRTFDGVALGQIDTMHDLELVAMVKGASRAAAFIVMELLLTHSPDVVAAIPQVFEQWAVASQEMKALDADAVRTYEERMVDEVAALVWHQCPDGYYPPDERTGPVEEHFRTTHLVGGATPRPHTIFTRFFDKSVYCEECREYIEVAPMKQGWRI